MMRVLTRSSPENLFGWLTDGGNMCRIKLTLREPAQHARLSNARVSQNEQPEQKVVLFSHDEVLKNIEEKA